MPNPTDIISRLNQRFIGAIQDRESPDYLTRDIGGQWRTNHPYISGYFQVWFGVPEALFGNTAANAVAWLHSTCESFTPHTVTLTKVDVMGQGQVGSSYVANVTTTREFTLAFREYQNLPILNIIRMWAAVFDPHTGVSPLVGGSKAVPKSFLPINYKGWCAVLQTKPTRSDGNPLRGSRCYDPQDIEEVYVYQGVFPTTIPLDALNSDQTANDTVQLSVTFSFDGYPLTSAEPGVVEKVLSFFNNFRHTDTYAKYRAIVE